MPADVQDFLQLGLLWYLSNGANSCAVVVTVDIVGPSNSVITDGDAVLSI